MPRMMWSREDALSPGLRLSSTVTLGRARGTPNYPGWGPGSYLSFSSEGKYTGGLMAYCHSEKVLGIMAQMEPPNQVGFGVGHPVVFSLLPGERIVSVWVWNAPVVRSTPFAGPYYQVRIPSLTGMLCRC